MWAGSQVGTIIKWREEKKEEKKEIEKKKNEKSEIVNLNFLNSYAWVSLQSNTPQKATGPATPTASISSLLSSPSSPPFSTALVAVDNEDKRIHFFNFNIKNQGILRFILILGYVLLIQV